MSRKQKLEEFDIFLAWSKQEDVLQSCFNWESEET